MQPSHDHEQRLTDLEIKASFSEDLLDALNQTVFRQQQQIDRLTHELLLLRQQAIDAASDPPLASRDELPPHY